MSVHLTNDGLAQVLRVLGLDGIHGDAGAGWHIEQQPDELARFCAEMQALGVESVLEVGTGRAAGLARFWHTVLGWRVTSIDVRTPAYRAEGMAFVLTRPGVYPTFAHPFDLVFIDGDHRYDGVKADHEHYAPFAAKVVAFHDIDNSHPSCDDVRRYWRDIRRDDWQEIVNDGPTRAGIGYYCV